MQRALVTGGGTGIGRGIALALSQRGWAVALAGRRLAPLADVVKEIEVNGGRAAALTVDLAQVEACLNLVERARQALEGELDGLVNNAGVMLPGRLERLAAADLQQAVQVNLTAPLLLTRAALPDLSASQRRTGRPGRVALVASQAARMALPYAAVYSATKAGLYGLGEALRFELEEAGVHLLTANPPAVETAMTAALTRPALPPILAGLGRAADPLQIGEQIAAALERCQAELNWVDAQTALIWLYQIWPWAGRRLLRSQLGLFRGLMNAGPPVEEDE